MIAGVVRFSISAAVYLCRMNENLEAIHAEALVAVAKVLALVCAAVVQGVLIGVVFERLG